MKVRNILDRKGGSVVTVGQDVTVHEAIRRLNEHRIGALVVTTEDGAIAGIITERDILRECGERCVRLGEVPPPHDAGCPALVGDIMTKDVVTGSLDDEVISVMAVMTRRRIRHLPVMDAGKLAGIVSIGDVVNAFVEEAEFENQQLKGYIHGVT